MMAVQRQADGDRGVVAAAQQHHRAPPRQRDDEVGGPGNAMGVDDHGADIVQRDAAHFFAILRDDEETAQGGKMAAVGGDIDNPVHPSARSPRSGPLARFAPGGAGGEAGIEDAAEFVHDNLPSLPFFQTGGGRECIAEVGLFIPVASIDIGFM